MIELSNLTRLIIRKFYNSKYQEAVNELLTHECSDNLPFAKNWNSEQMERIRFAVMKLSNGEYSGLVESVQLAKVDWRDVLIASGFASSSEEHKSWAEEILNDK